MLDYWNMLAQSPNPNVTVQLSNEWKKKTVSWNCLRYIKIQPFACPLCWTCPLYVSMKLYLLSCTKTKPCPVGKGPHLKSTWWQGSQALETKQQLENGKLSCTGTMCGYGSMYIMLYRLSYGAYITDLLRLDWYGNSSIWMWMDRKHAVTDNTVQYTWINRKSASCKCFRWYLV